MSFLEVWPLNIWPAASPGPHWGWWPSVFRLGPECAGGCPGCVKLPGPSLLRTTESPQAVTLCRGGTQRPAPRPAARRALNAAEEDPGFQEQLLLLEASAEPSVLGAQSGSSGPEAGCSSAPLQRVSGAPPAPQLRGDKKPTGDDVSLCPSPFRVGAPRPAPVRCLFSNPCWVISGASVALAPS